MNRFNFSLIAGVIFLVTVFPACDKTMSIPVYLQIDSAQLSTNYYAQGTASEAISDIWVTVNGKNMGVYELPATIPIMASGNTSLQLTAGIKMNGMVIKRPLYPFYTVDVRNMELIPSKTYTITPSFTYSDNAEFAYKEDFEDAGIKFAPIDNSVPMSKTSDPSLIFDYKNENSRYSGYISLMPEDSTYFEVQTTTTFSKKKTYCFMEMNYNFTHDVEVGIYYHYSGRNYQYPICGIYGSKSKSNSTGWKKIYINLTEALNSSTLISDFEIYIKGIKEKQDTAVYMFDNIKVLYI